MSLELEQKCHITSLNNEELLIEAKPNGSYRLNFGADMLEDEAIKLAKSLEEEMKNKPKEITILFDFKTQVKEMSFAEKEIARLENFIKNNRTHTRILKMWF